MQGLEPTVRFYATRPAPRKSPGWPSLAIPDHPLAAYCRPENKVSLGFVARLNNKIRVIQRRAYGLRDEDYLRLKVLTCTLPAL